MIKKMMFALTALMVLFFSNSVYAHETVSKDITTNVNDFIRITSTGGSWRIDYRYTPELKFEITESNPRQFKEGKTIYFSTDTLFSLESSGTVTCENGSVDLTTDLIQTPTENIYAIRFNSVKRQGKSPLTIRFALSPYISADDAKNNVNTFFPLNLITGTAYEDNLFSKNENGTILLNEKFFSAIDTAEPTDGSKQFISIKLGEHFLIKNGKSFISLMDIANVFSIPYSTAVNDQETQTVTFTKK